MALVVVLLQQVAESLPLPARPGSRTVTLSVSMFCVMNCLLVRVTLTL